MSYVTGFLLLLLLIEVSGQHETGQSGSGTKDPSKLDWREIGRDFANWGQSLLTRWRDKQGPGPDSKQKKLQDGVAWKKFAQVNSNSNGTSFSYKSPDGSFSASFQADGSAHYSGPESTFNNKSKP